MSDLQINQETEEAAEEILEEMGRDKKAIADEPLEADTAGWIREIRENHTDPEDITVFIGSHYLKNNTNRLYAKASIDDMQAESFGYMDRVQFNPVLEENNIRATNVTIETRAEDFEYAEFPEHGLTEKMSPEERAAMDEQRAKSEFYEKPEKSDDEDDDGPSNPLTDDVAGSRNDLL